MTAGPSLPVYVIHWCAPERCIATLTKLAASAGVAPILHVIDNSPGVLDQHRVVLDDLGVTVLESAENLGFAGGANAGLAHCLATYPDAGACVIAAHDVEVTPGCLASLHAAWEHTGSAVAGPRFGEDGRVLGGRWNGHRARWRREDWPASSATLDVDWLLGALLLVDTEWVRMHGGFDARLGSYVEDVDLCLRAHRTRRRVVCVRDARATEAGRTVSDVTRLVDRNTMWVAFKQSGWAGLLRSLVFTLWLALKAGLASLHPGRTSVRRATSRQRALAHLSAIVDVVRGGDELRSLRSTTDDIANRVAGVG